MVSGGTVVLLENAPHVWPRHLISLEVRLRRIPRHHPFISVEGRYLRVPGTVVDYENVQPVDANDHEDVVRHIRALPDTLDRERMHPSR